MDEVVGAIQISAKNTPADPVSASAVDLRQPGISQANSICNECCKRYEFRVVVHHLVINFVSEQDDVMLFRQRDDLLQCLPAIDRTARVVRIYNNNRFGLGSNQRLDLAYIGHERVF